MSRFVVLYHACPPDFERPSHWDLMFEVGELLRTWALAAAPDSAPSVAAEKLADHRLAYLDYEGPVSRGRGTVTRWDRGQYSVERESDRELVVHLEGENLRGVASLSLENSGSDDWHLTFQSEDCEDL